MPNADTAAMTAAYQAKKHTQDALHVVNSTLPQPVISVPHHEIAKFSHTKKVGQYLLGKTLGEGSFAKVKEGLHVITGETVAVKIIDKMKARQDPYIRRNMRREGKILQMVRHPNIIKLLETMETDNHYYLIMEFCRNGNVMSKVTTASNCTGMSEAEVRKYLRQLISAVDYLHRAGIVHRDLKIENLLLDNDDNIRLIDFGLSNCMKCLQKSGSVNDPVTTPRTLFHTQCGSPAYAAPELLSRKTYSTKVDVWSVGVNMFVLLTGRLPFTVEPYNLKKLFSKMIHRDMNSIPPFLSQ
uniref:Hormonally up-regulated neu tumor-associated kinase homolog A-like n=1 Tax=Saccoglossus kowalevskii TaxID=10224 RepID=A0ABM0MTK8_SACKO